MFSKYIKYIGVASGCAGLGLGYIVCKCSVPNDGLLVNLKSDLIARAGDTVQDPSFKCDFSAAINKSRIALLRAKEVSGTPGVSIAVNVDGKTVWTEGFGLADVENDVPCTPQTVMRIASVSKSITVAVLARLWQEGLVDLDKPVQEYVPKFPVHSFNGEKVDITTRMLVSHLSGIRHYKKKQNNNSLEDSNRNSSGGDSDETGGGNNNSLGANLEKSGGGNINNSSGANCDKTGEDNAKKTPKMNTDKTNEAKVIANNGKQKSDTEFKEFYMTKKFTSVEEALNIFKDDELFHKPGTNFLYTTYGWTLVSAVIEAATKSTFPKIMTEFFSQMGMKNTSLDYNEPIVYHRARYYSRVTNKHSKLQNSHFVDNSYKWAGGGMQSNVGDLTRFADIMLYCLQQNENHHPGYLKAATVEDLWSVKATTPGAVRGAGYGMGWGVVPYRHEFGWGDEQAQVVYHTGGAMGASSILFLKPRSKPGVDNPPAGVTVAILGNLDNVNWLGAASYIAQSFEDVVTLQN